MNGIMDEIIYLKEVVGRIECKGMTFILYATGNAGYDEKNSQLVVQLNCALEPENESDGRLPANLPLPGPQTEKETVDREESAEMAKEIFDAWVHRIRSRLEETALSTRTFTLS